jgi:hypothetical protein
MLQRRSTCGGTPSCCAASATSAVGVPPSGLRLLVPPMHAEIKLKASNNAAVWQSWRGHMRCCGPMLLSVG